MTVSESPASPNSSIPPQRRDKQSPSVPQASLNRGHSQRADSLADMLSLDRLISQGIHEDWASRLSRASAESTKKRMLARARHILEVTKRSW